MTDDNSSSNSSFLSGFVSGLQQIGGSLKQKFSSVAEQTLGDFEREQQEFVLNKRKQAGESASLPPWTDGDEKLKQQILALSSDERNFLRDPPPGAKQFEFSFASDFPVALAILQEDSRLEQMRFQLVPSKLSEESFWRNYFYRVRLIQQSCSLSSFGADDKTTEPVVDDEGTVSNEVQLQENLSTDSRADFQATLKTETSSVLEALDESSESPTDKSFVGSDWDSALQEELDNLDLEELENEESDDIEAQLADMLAEEN